eukprot:GSMAST32.ASY1.ANO1.2840.1 assembled CDS
MKINSSQKKRGITQKIFVPTDGKRNYRGLLIGPKGATLRGMEETSGCRIMIRGKGSSKTETDSDEPMNVVIDGDTQEKVDHAAMLVNNLINNVGGTADSLKVAQLHSVKESFNKEFQQTGFSHNGDISVDVLIPERMVGYIIGRGGENIRSLQARSLAHVQVKKPEENGCVGDKRKVVCTGTQDSVNIARNLIEALLAERGDNGAPSRGGECRRDYLLPNNHVGIIIGKRGETIKGIQARTRTNVKIPSDCIPGMQNENGQMLRRVHITGPTEEMIDAAFEEMDALCASDMGSGTNGITIPDNKVGIIIGRQGAMIKCLQQVTRTDIQIPNEKDTGSYPPTRTLEIWGTNPESVKEVKQIMLDLASEDRVHRQRAQEALGVGRNNLGTPGEYSRRGEGANFYAGFAQGQERQADEPYRYNGGPAAGGGYGQQQYGGGQQYGNQYEQQPVSSEQHKAAWAAYYAQQSAQQAGAGSYGNQQQQQHSPQASNQQQYGQAPAANQTPDEAAAAHKAAWDAYYAQQAQLNGNAQQ